MMLPYTGWNAELNFQVSLFNKRGAEIRSASSCLQYREITEKIIEPFYLYVECILT